jgi:hypothetical protein
MPSKISVVRLSVVYGECRTFIVALIGFQAERRCTTHSNYWFQSLGLPDPFMQLYLILSRQYVPYQAYHPSHSIAIIRKDCFQVKSNLLTVDNLVFHF